MASESFWASRRHFTPDEFDHPNEMDDGFIALLDIARGEAGVPFIIDSSFRPGDEKCHGHGKAVDLRCKDSHTRFLILRTLFMVGFTRIGVYLQEGAKGGHIHVDWCPEEDGFPQEMCWTGKSKSSDRS